MKPGLGEFAKNTILIVFFLGIFSAKSIAHDFENEKRHITEQEKSIVAAIKISIDRGMNSFLTTDLGAREKKDSQILKIFEYMKPRCKGEHQIYLMSEKILSKDANYARYFIRCSGGPFVLSLYNYFNGREWDLEGLKLTARMSQMEWKE